MINWRVERVNGRNVPTLIVLRECGKLREVIRQSLLVWEQEPDLVLQQLRAEGLFDKGGSANGGGLLANLGVAREHDDWILMFFSLRIRMRSAPVMLPIPWFVISRSVPVSRMCERASSALENMAMLLWGYKRSSIVFSRKRASASSSASVMRWAFIRKHRC
jgi:hypothetical protein